MGHVSCRDWCTGAAEIPFEERGVSFFVRHPCSTAAAQSQPDPAATGAFTGIGAGDLGERGDRAAAPTATRGWGGRRRRQCTTNTSVAGEARRCVDTVGRRRWQWHSDRESRSRDGGRAVSAYWAICAEAQCGADTTLADVGRAEISLQK
jgi:hypothetical protein